MADNIKDSFKESNLHTEVVIQRGTLLADFELNEAFRISRAASQRILEEGVLNVASGEDFSPGANGNGLKPTVSGPNLLALGAGPVVAKGVQFNWSASTVALPNNPGPGSAVYAVYLRIQEVEVPDPAALAGISELSRRRKLVVDVLVSTTGLPGVPASSSVDYWAGGVKYDPIALVVRRANDSSLTLNDITDLRRLLPPSVVADITRQEKFVVKAVVARQIEGKGKELPYVVGANGAVPAEPWDYVHTFWASKGPLGPDGDGYQIRIAQLRPFGVDVGTSDETGYIEARGNPGETKGGSVGTNVASLGFHDGNTDSIDTQRVWLSSEDEKDVKVFGKNHLATGAPQSGVRSMLTAINSRWSVSCGDGVNTFGDFNGASAVKDAFDYFNVAYPTGGICHIFVKPGDYLTPGTLTLANKTHLILEGDGFFDRAPALAFPDATSSVAAITVGDSCALTLKGLAMGVLTETGLALQVKGYARIEDTGIIGHTRLGPFTADSSAYTRARVGLHATRSTFTAPDASPQGGSNAIEIVSSPSPAGADTRRQIDIAFEDCHVWANRSGSNVRIVATSATENHVHNLSFVRCAFHPPHLGEDQPDGIFSVTAPDAFAGYMHVDNLLFEGCSLALETASRDVVVFNLRAGNDSDGSPGVFFHQMTMRGCNWKVYDEFNRTCVPWAITSMDTDAVLAASSQTFQHSIINLTIEDTSFGFKAYAGHTAGENSYGTDLTMVTTEMAGALALSAENLTIRNLRMDGMSTYCGGVSDAVIYGCRNLSVDGFQVNVEYTGDEAKTLPEARVQIYPTYNNSFGARKTVKYLVKGLNITTLRASGTSANAALLRVIPGGNAKFEACSFIGYSEDVVALLDCTLMSANYGSGDYSGLTFSNCFFDYGDVSFKMPLPGSGTLTSVSDIVFSHCTFNDPYSRCFLVSEPTPAGNSAYHTTVTNFRLDHCVQTRSTRETVRANSLFKVGASHDILTPDTSSRIMNVVMKGNDIGHVILGTNDALLTEGLRCIYMGNSGDATIYNGSPDTKAESRGFETGYSAADGDMVPDRQWTSTKDMLHNRGKLILS